MKPILTLTDSGENEGYPDSAKKKRAIQKFQGDTFRV